MKIRYAFLLLVLLTQVVLAQTKRPEKQTNTQKNKSVKPAPDLVGLITINPDVVHGTTPITAIIDVVEIKNVPTSGLITVYIRKDTSFVHFKFDPTATSVNNSTIRNADWTFDETANPNYYVLTSTKVIAGGKMSTIGLTGTFRSMSTGRLGISMTILKDSGGEANHLNNTASTTLNFSPQ